MLFHTSHLPLPTSVHATSSSVPKLFLLQENHFPPTEKVVPRRRAPRFRGPRDQVPLRKPAAHDGSPASASPGDGAAGDVSVTGYCKQTAFIGEQIIREPSGSGSPSRLGAAFKGRSCFRLVLVVRRCTSVSRRFQPPPLPFTLFFLFSLPFPNSPVCLRIFFFAISESHANRFCLSSPPLVLFLVILLTSSPQHRLNPSAVESRLNHNLL